MKSLYCFPLITALTLFSASGHANEASLASSPLSTWIEQNKEADKDMIPRKFSQLPESVQLSYCEEILGKDFPQTAQKLGLGIFKRNALTNYCQKFKATKKALDVGQLKATTPSVPQKEPIKSASKATLTQKISIPEAFQRTGSQENDIKEVQKILSDLKQKIETPQTKTTTTTTTSSSSHKEKIVAIEKKIKEAQENFDSMKAIITLFKEDLESIAKNNVQYKPLNVGSISHLEHEEYLMALLEKLENTSNMVLFNTITGHQQVFQAQEFLKQSKKNLDDAYKEMLGLTQP